MATTKATIKFGESRLTIEDIVAISKQEKHVSISNAPELTNKIDSALAFLDGLLKED
ncbi:MAG: histidine ammonia-lyase, partial [Moritella sp.]|nr:histidine ammonia-lyase [Moritella sp.]